jgi:hypothetical protein
MPASLERPLAPILYAEAGQNNEICGILEYTNYVVGYMSVAVSFRHLGPVGV